MVVRLQDALKEQAVKFTLVLAYLNTLQLVNPVILSDIDVVSVANPENTTQHFQFQLV